MNNKCLLTGKDVNYKHSESHLYYSLNFDGKEVDIFICENCKRKIDFNVPAHIVEGLIANEKWPERIEFVSEGCTLSKHVTDCETVVLQEYLRTADYPKSPKEKLDNLTLSLFNLQKYDGESIHLNIRQNNFATKNYFKNPEECAF